MIKMLEFIGEFMQLTKAHVRPSVFIKRLLTPVPTIHTHVKLKERNVNNDFAFNPSYSIYGLTIII